MSASPCKEKAAEVFEYDEVLEEHFYTPRLKPVEQVASTVLVRQLRIYIPKEESDEQLFDRIEASLGQPIFQSVM